MVLLTHFSHAYTLQLTGDVLTQSFFKPTFLSTFIYFPTPKLSVTLSRIEFPLMLTSYTISKEENSHHLENLFKTSVTQTKVLSCLKIPLTNMRVDCFKSYENIIPWFQTPSTLHPPKSPWRTPLTACAEEFYYSFNYNEGQENKLRRASLSGLAKSIH